MSALKEGMSLWVIALYLNTSLQVLVSTPSLQAECHTDMMFQKMCCAQICALFPINVFL
jgi:hypothetical protein